MTGTRRTRSRILAPRPANDAAILESPYVGESGTDGSPSAAPAGTHSPAGSYIARGSSNALTRVFCDFPDGIAITIGEVELFETYLADLISGMIANDTDA
jgi:hypothetical protein